MCTSQSTKKALPITDRKGELALYHLRLHRSIYIHINSNASCPVTWTNRKNLCQILLYIYRFNFLGSSAQKLPSMISVLSTFQPAQNVSPSYGPDALSESFRHVLLFLMPLNILPVSFYNIKVHWVICQYDFSIIIMTFT